MNIIIIKPRGGLTTSEQILKLMEKYSQGISIPEISQQLNRPVSMINICLNTLLKNKRIHRQLEGRKWIYYANTKQSSKKSRGK